MEQTKAVWFAGYSAARAQAEAIARLYEVELAHLAQEQVMAEVRSAGTTLGHRTGPFSIEVEAMRQSSVAAGQIADAIRAVDANGLPRAMTYRP